MESILHSFYNGKIIPWERKASRNEALLEIARKIDGEERYFVQKMSLDDGERFQALSSLYTDLFSLEEEDTFSYGFALGLLLMADVMKVAETLRNE